MLESLKDNGILLISTNKDEKTIIKEPETKLNGKIYGVVSDSKPELTDITPSETITNEVEKIKDNTEKSEGKN